MSDEYIKALLEGDADEIVRAGTTLAAEEQRMLLWHCLDRLIADNSISAFRLSQLLLALRAILSSNNPVIAPDEAAEAAVRLATFLKKQKDVDTQDEIIAILGHLNSRIARSETAKRLELAKVLRGDQ
jgi:hypothetical protein